MAGRLAQRLRRSSINGIHRAAPPVPKERAVRQPSVVAEGPPETPKFGALRWAGPEFASADRPISRPVERAPHAAQGIFRSRPGLDAPEEPPGATQLLLALRRAPRIRPCPSEFFWISERVHGNGARRPLPNSYGGEGKKKKTFLDVFLGLLAPACSVRMAALMLSARHFFSLHP